MTNREYKRYLDEQATKLFPESADPYHPMYEQANLERRIWLEDHAPRLITKRRRFLVGGLGIVAILAMAIATFSKWGAHIAGHR